MLYAYSQRASERHMKRVNWLNDLLTCKPNEESKNQFSQNAYRFKYELHLIF